MTNYEKYKDEIIDIISESGYIAVKNNMPINCEKTEYCKECDLDINDCKVARRNWLNAEYKEPITLTEREHTFCLLMETGYIARDNTEALYYYCKKPLKGSHVWCQNSGTRKSFALLDILSELQFPFIQ